MIEGSWMPRQFVPLQDFENQIGFLPMFPVPNEGNQSFTLMGGWEFSRPITSTHEDLAWKLVTLMVETKNTWSMACGTLASTDPSSVRRGANKH
jgi:multiple sugar transport system substrate-binding protein